MMEHGHRENKFRGPKAKGEAYDQFIRKKRTKGDAVERALRDVEELAKLATTKKPGLPYGHNGWIREIEENRVPIPKEKLEKYKRGAGLSSKVDNVKLQNKEKEIQFSIEQAARTEILLTEDPGFIVTEDGETSTQFTQKQIVKNVDQLSAAKHFELFLQEFGPYRINYTRNGRNLLLGGRKGHIAAFDWMTKKPACEINVMEEIFDVQWLHNETMFAVAQKSWVYIYDNQGVEIHCLKNLHNVLRMDFLPYHFLLATSSSAGYVSWLDVSVGKIVSKFRVIPGRLNIMTQNPYNAVVCLGHTNGTVSMWSPNLREPLAKMLCHKCPLSAIAVTKNGKYMATSAVDRSVAIWDIRQFKGPLQNYRLHGVASNLTFSDRSLLAMSLGNVVEVYRDCCSTTADCTYLRHRVNHSVTDIQFCPYEDVLGVGSGSGFCSLLVPGAGEPNFDALESNPFQNRSQRREAEVKNLLEKIQPELISLDPYSIGDVNVPTLQEKLEAKKKLMLGQPPKIDFTPRRKGRLKGTVSSTRAKKIVKERGRMAFAKTMRELSKKTKKESEERPQERKPQSVLDRFLPQKKKK